MGFYYETGRAGSWIPNFWNILYKKLHGDMFICIVLTCFECQFIFSLTKNSVSENSDPKPEPNLVPAEPIWFRLEPIWFRLQKFSSECYFRHFRVPDWSEIILGWWFMPQIIIGAADKFTWLVDCPITKWLLLIVSIDQDCTDRTIPSPIYS